MSHISRTVTAGNPSEHTVTATAQIHDSIGIIALNSTDPANRTYAPSGMGRAADDIIADVRLQSVGFYGASVLTLRDQADVLDASGNVTANGLVPVPQMAWSPTSGVLLTSRQAGYVAGGKPKFKFTLSQADGTSLSGSATLGLSFKMTAQPNTTDASIVLKDTGTTPVGFSGSATWLDADNPLLSKIATYATSISSLTVSAEFTHIAATPIWVVLHSYANPNAILGNKLYSVLATPTAPMAQPWVRVLDNSCSWAVGDTDATTAAKDLTKNFYLNGAYNPNQVWYTLDYLAPNTNAFVSQDFYLLDFLNRTKNSSNSHFTGQCEDFSDFLVCLSTSVGARPLMAQLSASTTSIKAGTSSFNTQKVTSAPQVPPTLPSPYDPFSFHQWTNDTTIFDAAIRFGGTSTTPGTTPADIAGPAAGTAYYNSLVDPPVVPPASSWNPQPPLTPTIYNHSHNN